MLREQNLLNTVIESITDFQCCIIIHTLYTALTPYNCGVCVYIPVLDKIVVDSIVASIPSDDHGMSQGSTGAP